MASSLSAYVKRQTHNKISYESIINFNLQFVNWGGVILQNRSRALTGQWQNTGFCKMWPRRHDDMGKAATVLISGFPFCMVKAKETSF